MNVNYDFRPIVQGSTWRRVLTWRPGGTAANLTSYTARMQVRDKLGGSVVLDLTTENDGITLGGAAGTITLVVTDEQCAALRVPDSPGRKDFVYDIKLIPASGEAFKLMYGKWPVVRGVTQ
jgi:hypothetical protein